MKPEAQYSGFIERFQSYSKEYSTLKDCYIWALKDAILLNMFPSEITETEISALLHQPDPYTGGYATAKQ